MASYRKLGLVGFVLGTALYVGACGSSDSTVDSGAGGGGVGGEAGDAGPGGKNQGGSGGGVQGGTGAGPSDTGGEGGSGGVTGGSGGDGGGGEGGSGAGGEGGSGAGGDGGSGAGGEGGSGAGGEGADGGGGSGGVPEGGDVDGDWEDEDEGVDDADADGEGDDADSGEETGDPVDPDHKLLMIVVTPQNKLVELDLGTGGTQLFKATGKYMDGKDEDLSGKVVWATDPPGLLGTFGSPAGTLNLSAVGTAGTKTATISATFEGKVGKAAFTVVSYVKSGVKPDFFFLLPYMDPAGPQGPKELEFQTAVQNMDVFFNLDTTGSMSGEITNLRSSLNNIVTTMNGLVSNAQYGCGEYKDFYMTTGPSYGASGDVPFRLRTAITSSTTAVASGLAAMTATGGGDGPESMIEALYQIATGEGMNYPTANLVPPNHAGRGGVGFRVDSIPIIISITDNPSHGVADTLCPANNYTGTLASYAHSRSQAKAGLTNMCARAVGVNSSGSSSIGCTARGDLEDFAIATGALIPPSAWDPSELGTTGTRPCAANMCCTGSNNAAVSPRAGTGPDGTAWCPLVFDISTNGSGMGTAVQTGFRMLIRYVKFDVLSVKNGVTTGVYGETMPAGKNTADFIGTIVPKNYDPAPTPPVYNPGAYQDTVAFRRMTPGVKVRFNVTAYNDFIPATNVAQYFKATISVTAQGCFPLDAREVLIVIPPRPLEVPW